MNERADKLRALQLDEARAAGSLIGIANTMLIYHEHGGARPEHWVRLRETYDAYQACSRAVTDCWYEAIERVRT